MGMDAEGEQTGGSRNECFSVPYGVKKDGEGFFEERHVPARTEKVRVSPKTILTRLLSEKIGRVGGQMPDRLFFFSHYFHSDYVYGFFSQAEKFAKEVGVDLSDVYDDVASTMRERVETTEKGFVRNKYGQPREGAINDDDVRYIAGVSTGPLVGVSLFRDYLDGKLLPPKAEERRKFTTPDQQILEQTPYENEVQGRISQIFGERVTAVQQLRQNFTPTLPPTS